MPYIFENTEPNKLVPTLSLVPKFDYRNRDIEKHDVLDNKDSSTYLKRYDENIKSDGKVGDTTVSKDGVQIGKNNNWKNFGSNPGYESLKKGSKIKIGEDAIMVTDPYGFRNFKGREGEHSTGIDYTTASGNAVAIKDGTIIDVKLQGNGSVISPQQGNAGGYYVVVKHDDGSYGQYMHLDPMSTEEMNTLKNKIIKRGDKIAGYTKGSGSMTGKHVKFRLYGQNPRINIDPSQAFRGESYSFIPNSRGENILK